MSNTVLKVTGGYVICSGSPNFEKMVLFGGVSFNYCPTFSFGSVIMKDQVSFASSFLVSGTLVVQDGRYVSR